MRNENKANKELRKRITAAGLFDWQLALRLGISDSTLCKWLRVEIPEDDPRYRMILQALEGETNGKDKGQTT